jgi:hypothetical protein
LIPVDPPHGEVAIYTVALTSLSHDRILATGSHQVDSGLWAVLAQQHARRE